MVMALRSFWITGGVGCLSSPTVAFSIFSCSNTNSGEELTRVF